MTIEHVVDPDGTQSWWTNGKLHREDGPAKINSDGSEYWFKNDIPHREDGPAVIDKFRRAKEWRINGKLHREDGPAYIRDDGYQEWHLNGQRHRENGPAIIYPDGLQLWFLNDIQNMSKRETKKYNTMLDIGFTVEHSFEDPYNIPINVLIAALEKRIENLRQNPDEKWEAFGVCDTYEIGHLHKRSDS